MKMMLLLIAASFISTVAGDQRKLDDNDVGIDDANAAALDWIAAELRSIATGNPPSPPAALALHPKHKSDPPNKKA